MKDGIKVRGCSVEETYPGMMAGIPSKGMNYRIIDRLRKNGMYVIVDENHYSNDETERRNKFGLPYWLVTVLLHSYDLTEEEYKEFEFRELKVAFFHSKPFDHPINEMVEEAIKDLDWEKESKLYSL